MTTNCPWSSYTQATVSFCEAQICNIIVKPAEAWSNVGYVLFGIYIIHRCQRELNKHLLILGIVGVLLGIGSGIFHATGTFFGEYLDVSGMFLYVVMGIVFATRRLFKIKFSLMIPLFIFLQILCMSLLWFIKPIGITLFGLLFTGVLILELALYKRDRNIIDYKYFFLFIGTFGIALAVWLLDIFKIWCDPNNHYFSGHSFWHLVTSLSFYFNYQFLKQIPELRK